MNIEEMIKFLGIRTQSYESICLCYQMDMEAFNMMNDEKLKDERNMYTYVYELLLDALDYEKLNNDKKNDLEAKVANYSYIEEDKDYRDLYFTGLERVLLKYNHFEMVAFQRIKESDHDGIAKDAYLHELRGNYSVAMKYYNMIGESERYSICIKKLIA